MRVSRPRSTQPRQKTQQIVKQACQKAGIDIEIKSVTASVFFSSDVGEPGHISAFLLRPADVHAPSMTAPDPGVCMRQFLSCEARARRTSGRAATSRAGRARSYDRLYQQSETELDPVKRAALFIAMNDLVVRNVVVIPVIARPQVLAVAKDLHVVLSGWDASTFAIQDWYRDV